MSEVWNFPDLILAWQWPFSPLLLCFSFLCGVKSIWLGHFISNEKKIVEKYISAITSKLWDRIAQVVQLLEKWWWKSSEVLIESYQNLWEGALGTINFRS